VRVIASPDDKMDGLSYHNGSWWKVDKAIQANIGCLEQAARIKYK